MDEGLNHTALTELFPPEKEDAAANHSPLVLAYIGDAVYELIVRTGVVAKGDRQVNLLHHSTVHLVKAESQAKMARHMDPELTERERSVLRRGRNAHSNTAAKNASIVDYRVATGFEALVGYLWLSGQRQRLKELLDRNIAWLLETEKKEGRPAGNPKVVPEERNSGRAGTDTQTTDGEI